jgi:signal peptidase I
MTPYLMIVAVLLAGGAAVGSLRWRLRVVTVVGDSMRPTLAPGDRLLVRRIPLARVRTGDIVVLAFPAFSGGIGSQPDGDRWLIKRAVATPGDPVPASVAPVLSIRPGSPVRDGALVVIGDNRDASFDSRMFGYVNASDLLGVVLRPMRGAR